MIAGDVDTGAGSGRPRQVVTGGDGLQYPGGHDASPNSAAAAAAARSASGSTST